MRYLVYGAGAIGGVIGAKLFLQGKDVLLIARGPHLKALQTQGLELRYADRSQTLAIPAVAGPREIEFQTDDVVLLTTKSQDTQAALDELRLFADDTLPVVCCQNGVENERIAVRRFGRVYGVIVMVPGIHLEPGVVEAGLWPRSGALDIGCYPLGRDALAEQVAKDLNDSGFDSRARPDIMRWKYTKLHENVANVIPALLGAAPADLITRARREAEACYAAANIDWVQPGEFEERNWPRREVPPTVQGGSTWQSLARAAGSIEVDFLNGEIAMLGTLHGVATPVNKALQILGHRAAWARIGPGHLDPLELSQEIERRMASGLDTRNA